MSGPENDLNGRFDGPVVLEDAKGFLRPEDFAARNTPAEAAGAAQRLRFSQIGLAPLQFGGPFHHLHLEPVARPTKRLLAVVERFLRALAVGDVGAAAEPFDDPAFAVADRRASRLEPAVRSIMPANAVFHVIGPASRHRISPDLPGIFPI